MDSSRPSSSFAAQPWHSCHKLIYVRPNSKTGVPVGHWPIPESFWPDQNLPSLVSIIKQKVNIIQDFQFADYSEPFKKAFRLLSHAVYLLSEV